ncbi:MAG: nuclear transport factor 2 family protein [Candidatus Binatia bacterium]
MSSSIDAVADELAIRDLVQRYCDATTRLDARGVVECFAADGEWSYLQVGHPRGHDEMLPLFTALLDGWKGFLHVEPSGRILLHPTDRDRASGRWYVMEMGQRSDGTDLVVWGVNHDAYVREAGVWRISRRRYDRLFMRMGRDELIVSPFPPDAPDIE